MIKPGNLSPFLKATSQIASSNLKSVPPAAVLPKRVSTKPPLLLLSSYSLSKSLTSSGNVLIVSGPTTPTQARFAHTDITVPDFSAYRRESVKSPRVKASESEGGRKVFTYLVAGAAGVTGVYASKGVVTQLVMTMSASADVLALAKIEVKLSDIPEGKSVTFKWRGKKCLIFYHYL